MIGKIRWLVKEVIQPQIYADGRWDEELVLQAFLPVLSLAPGESKNRQEYVYLVEMLVVD